MTVRATTRTASALARDSWTRTAQAPAGAADLLGGRNTLFAAVDADGDGRSENVASSTFRWSGGAPQLLGAACKRAITPRAGENHTIPVYMAGFGNDRRACTPGEQAPPDANCQFGPAHDDLWARGFVDRRARPRSRS